MVESSSQESTASLVLLVRFVDKAKDILGKGDVKLGQLKIWSGGVRSHLKKIYGEGHPVIESLSPGLISAHVDPSKELAQRTNLLEQFVSEIDRVGESLLLQKNLGSRVFIGHGQSPIWRELKDFLSDRLSLPWDEFNREAVAGLSTFERISSMLDSASFAFLIMTAEDQHSDATSHARQNVVHEVGLFQGKLGPRRAIILLEQGCQEFTNIVGLSQIRFPPGRISAAFEEIRRVLEREGLIET
jgi:hypothetical protein